MYRILVVDDEEMITDSLATMLQETKEFELDVYKAYSGTEALEILNKYRMDVVISDICMPQMNGIDLVSKIREKWPECQVIFQSGYDDFKYAQQAIRHKVAHYILKSEGDENLLAAIEECIKTIEESNLRQVTLMKIKEENEMYKSILRYNQVKQGNLEKTELNLSNGMMLLAGRCSKEITQTMLFEIDAALRRKIGYAVVSDVLWFDSAVVVWGLQPMDKGNLEHAQAVVKGMAEELCQAVQQRFSVAISFVLQEKMITEKEVTASVEKIKCIAQRQLQPEFGIMMAGIEYFSEKEKIEMKEDGLEDEKSFINRLMLYMSEHIDGDLSLCTLSDKLHLNASYLSRRFKELVGKNLRDVILEMRMEKACELLRDTSIPVSEISLMVGYETKANFSKVFKKVMKQTPREYRDREGLIK
ncbi:MAG: response regulator [Bacillota bacterium]|nr:response regulator [Bacillota bacterium]